MRLRHLLLASLIALPLAAQEPRPARLAVFPVVDSDGVRLELAWRFAPGDDAGRALPQYDDSHWMPLRPDRAPAGTGWFRRHVEVAPDVQNRPLALTFAAPGVGDVYLDGTLVASAGSRETSPMIPADRRETAIVTFRGPTHVIAVRYVYPANAPRPNGSSGFRVILTKPVPPEQQQSRDWIVALHGALIALPLFLALLHLALYAFDRRARVNLFYAAEMLTFGLIIFHQYQSNFLASDLQRDLLDRISIGWPILAIFFGTLTYYAVRTNGVPRAWRVIAAIGVVLLVFAYAMRADNAWVIYFLVMLAEIVRLERSGQTVRRAGTNFFLASFVVFGAAIVLQVFVNLGLLQSVAGIVEVYVFGILASAVGMSLYLANNLGRSRMIEIESERKSEELARARRLQLAMLPKELPLAEGLDVAVATQPAAEVGGDYYDVRRDGGDALLFAFGDATGHGLASGIIVTAAKTLFMSMGPDGSLASHLCDFDRALRDMRLPAFLRMCLTLARVSPREAAVASAAMPPVLVRRASDASVHELGRGDVPLGSRLAARYRELRMELEPGDTLLFASDGFAEQPDGEGRQFGYDGVAGALKTAGNAAGAQEVVDRLLATAQEFRGSEPQRDDITLLVVRVTSASR